MSAIRFEKYNFVRMKRILILAGLVLGMVFSVLAQEDANSFREVDQRPWHYGFILGVNAYSFTVTPSTPSLMGAQVSSATPGFTVGILGDLRLSSMFNLRFTPTLNFTDRAISYFDFTSNKQLEDQIIKSTTIELPLYIKYRSIWYNRTRPYLIAGGGLSFDLMQNKNQPVLLHSNDVFIAFGVGCDIYFDFFRLAPELKFCLGLKDLLIPMDKRDAGAFSPDEQIFSNSLSHLRSKLFVLTFNFE
jgi:hypothetical protein